MKRPIKLLHPLETAMPPNDPDNERVDRKSNDSKEIDINHDKVTRPKRKANEIVRNKLKDYYADKIGAFFWCWEYRESRKI